MSRPIKFQAYDCKTKEMITWDEINEVDELGFLPFVDMLRTPERYKMRQFTGLHDRNGKEIYEGDIVYTPQFDWTGYVVFTGDCQYALKGKTELGNNGYVLFTQIYLNECEVIGNIYEDSHLLKGEEADDH